MSGKSSISLPSFIVLVFSSARRIEVSVLKFYERKIICLQVPYMLLLALTNRIYQHGANFIVHFLYFCNKCYIVYFWVSWKEGTNTTEYCLGKIRGFPNMIQIMNFIMRMKLLNKQHIKSVISERWLCSLVIILEYFYRRRNINLRSICSYLHYQTLDDWLSISIQNCVMNLFLVMCGKTSCQCKMTSSDAVNFPWFASWKVDFKTSESQNGVKWTKMFTNIKLMERHYTYFLIYCRPWLLRWKQICLLLNTEQKLNPSDQ